MAHIRWSGWGAAAALVLVAAPPATAQGARTPEAVVRAFYTYHFAHDMAFTPAAIRRRSRWLAPDLLEQIRVYFATPGPADQPSTIDGDPFTDSQEYPRTFRVGTATARGDSAFVPVTVAWPEGDRRVVTNVLVMSRGAWKIADLRFADGGTLRKLLREGS